MGKFNHYSRTDLTRTLQKSLCRYQSVEDFYPRKFSFPTPPTRAAILVPFLSVNDHWSLLFIRRTLSNDPHSGQVAFPGGRMESEDLTPEATSLREAQEEIGLSPADVEVIGKLPPLLTVTNYEIHPIVGMIPYPYLFQPSPSEVQKIFTIPLNWLANPLNYRIEERLLPPPVGRIPTIYYQPYQGEILWGASAQIVHTLLNLLNAQASSDQDEA